MSFDREIYLLTKLGFEIFDSSKDKHWEHDIEVEEGELLFIYPDGSRNSIYVKLNGSYNGNSIFAVYVLDDIGCGSTQMPYRWAELNEDWLTHLKLSFTLCTFKTND